MLIRRVTGNSMYPAIAPGDVVVAVHKTPAVGAIVIAHQAKRDVIKRIAAIDEDRYTLRGDNTEESLDSREFGPVKKQDILGVVMLTLPTAVAAPKVRHSKAPLIGVVAAGVMAIMALIHLFRIDTFMPLLNIAVPGGVKWAAFIGGSLLAMEVFAVPFLLRMKLSPLAHLVSGLFAVLVPLTWLLIAIWDFGFNTSTAQLGEFASTPSDWQLVGVNLVWLAFNVWVLWLLGYDKVTEALRKRR